MFRIRALIVPFLVAIRVIVGDAFAVFAADSGDLVQIPTADYCLRISSHVHDCP
eukprot:SAG22_NODE_17765_length_299_cov_0.415000_1_plen_53_part_01